MGNRRMFSRRITDSARFLKMGGGAQLLYFHLCMHADDDGVVEAYTVRRGIGANEDDMSNLAGRGFIKVLDPENEIVLVTDWYEHNKIRKDRLTPSIYRPLIQSAAPDVPLIEPTQRKDRVRTDVAPSYDGPGTDYGQHGDDNGTSHGQPDGSQRTTDGPHKVSKDKLRQEKTREVRTREENNGAHAPSRPTGFMRPSISDIESYCKEKGYAHVDAEYFWNFYENIGWKVGKNKMKSWKLAVANWEKRQIEFEREKHGATPSSKQSIVTRTPEEQAAQPKWGLFDD